MKRARLCLLLAIGLVIVLGFGSTVLANCPPYSVTSVTAEDSSTAMYQWTIDKEASPGEISIKNGQSATVEYTITLDKGPAEPYAVKGNLSFTANSDIYIYSITAWVGKQGVGPITAEKSVGDGHYDAGSHDIPCEFTFADDPGTIRIVYRITMYEGGPGSVYWSDYLELDPGEPVNDTVTVVDSHGALPLFIKATFNGQYKPGGWTVSESSAIQYAVTFRNDGRKEEWNGGFSNTATIQETGQCDNASVKINVPEVHPRDRSTPTPEPTAEAVAVELPKTGGLIEWEWIALAGGLLTSCGGGLYLMRRRRMKR